MPGGCDGCHDGGRLSIFLKKYLEVAFFVDDVFPKSSILSRLR